MPKKNQVLTDKFSGDSFEFLETGESTNGKFVKLKVTLKSKGKTVDDHIHLAQDELFEVISGRLACFVKGERSDLGAGERLELPRNVPHNHYNVEDETVVYHQTISPAYDIDYFVENLVGLINDGKVKDGQLPFLQAMVTAKYLESPSRLASIPMVPQNLLISVLGPLARLFGYRAIYKKYTGIEK